MNYAALNKLAQEALKQAAKVLSRQKHIAEAAVDVMKQAAKLLG